MTTELNSDAAALAPLHGLIGHTTTQGIPTLYAPRQGEMTAGLFFRVGRADETLATSGITHLVEHLALHRLGLSDLHYNGATANAYTLFHVTGSAHEVVSYLNSVCAALRDLPLDRLETEKEILRTEAAGRGTGTNHQMPLWRYGAQGYGLTSYGEMGTWRLTADEVRQWARTRFTRDNAVLWISSDRVPDGLDLTLPAGTRIPAPAASNTLPVNPAYIHGDDGAVVLDAVVPRTTAGALFADVLGRALFRDLRQEGGYSYTADCDYTPRDAYSATLTAYADALPKKQDAVVGGFVDTLARMRAGRIEQSELDSARARIAKQYEAPELGAAMLPSYALSLLLGHCVLSPAQHLAELHAVTVGDLREVARTMWSSALLQVPTRGADWAGFTLAPQYSQSPVNGTRHRSLENEGVTLTIGPEGVSLTTPKGPVTVRYEACALMTARPDGARTLTGFDGFVISIEPTLYQSVTPERIAAVDAAVHPAVVVRMPERDPQHIPRPRQQTARSTGTGAGASSKKAHWAWTAGLWLVGALAVVFGLLCAVATAQEAGAADPDIGVIVVLWVLELPLVAMTWTLHRLRKRSR